MIRRPRKHDAHLDFVGSRFGRLRVTGFVQSIKNTTLWSVRCDCGTEKTVRRTNLHANGIKSCGCLVREGMSERATTHGLTKPGLRHPLYSTWDSMKRRCHGKGAHSRYGGRGINVCERWLSGEDGKTGFECFLKDMGPRPEGCSIDRIDNNGPYSPENCRWATQKQQQRNRSSNRSVVFNGEVMLLVEAIELSGLNEATVYGRLKLGWSEQDALSTPVDRP